MTVRTLTFEVLGTPAPQGSTRAWVNKTTGRATVTSANKRTMPWRQDVIQACIDATQGWWTTPTGSLDVLVLFNLPRPKSHYRTGRNAHLLRDNAPAFPSGKPDLDKLLRSVFDALTDSGVIKDDAQIVAVNAGKHYADAARPGAVISISEAT